MTIDTDKIKKPKKKDTIKIVQGPDGTMYKISPDGDAELIETKRSVDRPAKEFFNKNKNKKTFKGADGRTYTTRGMEMPPDVRTDEQKKQDAKNALMDDMSAKPLTDKQIKEGIKLRRAKGGMVKKYMGGGSVHKNKKNMITTKGWGASRKT